MTSWQDVVFTLGGVIFAIALLPSVLRAETPSAFTSASTGLVLLTYVYAQWTLRLRFAAVTTCVTAALWLTLLVEASV